ncbi:NAD(P)/FAD-dependent oxidoreductase [Candidatus Woesearchaeota archaeon]|nr:NAD(P)/FAD-dependent oxidoreductase [Candidatus Woesearchaeota archaeon]
MYDIIIIGAGPAGLAAARELKKANINFLIIDSKKEIGLPLRCGEGIREKEFIEFFKHKNYYFVKNTINIHEIYYKDLTRTFKENFLELDRAEFEKWLAKPIKNHLRLSTTCQDLKIKENLIEIKINKEILTAKLAILAYGCNFNIQKKLNLVKKQPNMVLGYGGIFKNHNFEENKFYYFFDPKHLGYLWAFPKDKKTANIGFGAFNTNKNTKKIFKKLLKRYKINAKQLSEYAGIVPCSGPIKKTYADRLLICGNAAGQVHAFSGEGIYYGLVSGKLAAKTAVKAVKQNIFNDNFLKQYEKEWKKKIGKNMKAGIIASELLYLAFKNKEIKSLFKQPTEKELREMMLYGIVPLRARFVWKLAKIFNLLEKKELPLIVKIIYNIYKLIKKDEKSKVPKG